MLLLEPFKTVTVMMSSERTTTVSIVIPTMSMLINHLKDHSKYSGTVREAANVMLTDLEKRFVCLSLNLDWLLSYSPKTTYWLLA